MGRRRYFLGLLSTLQCFPLHLKSRIISRASTALRLIETLMKHYLQTGVLSSVGRSTRRFGRFTRRTLSGTYSWNGLTLILLSCCVIR